MPGRLSWKVPEIFELGDLRLRKIPLEANCLQPNSSLVVCAKTEWSFANAQTTYVGDLWFVLYAQLPAAFQFSEYTIHLSQDQFVSLSHSRRVQVRLQNFRTIERSSYLQKRPIKFGLPW